MSVQFHDFQPEFESLQNAVLKGLTQTPKSLPPKFFYDAFGSKIFEQICKQPEYYLPDAERNIFEQYTDEIIDCLGVDSHIIEPGAGSSEKIRFFLNHLTPAMYVPMDISADHLLASAHRLGQDFEHLSIHAVCVDHTRPYRLPKPIPLQNRVFFYPGSSLGNFEPIDARHFLSDIRNKAGVGGVFMIGIDTKKSSAILNSAYNDAAGFTAAFNLNLLQRINTELNSDINLNDFHHHAFYNEPESRIEMHLISRRRQHLNINGQTFSFEKDESIHTENSYKYTVSEFQLLARDSGWRPFKVWQDEQRLFSVHFLRA